MWRCPRSGPAQDQATRRCLPWGPKQPSHSLGDSTQAGQAVGTQRGPPGPHPSSDHRTVHCLEWPVTPVSN